MDYYNAFSDLGGAYNEGKRQRLADAGLEATAKYKGAQIQEYLREQTSMAREKAILSKQGITDKPEAMGLQPPVQQQPSLPPPMGVETQPQGISPEKMMQPEAMAYNPGEMYVKAGREMLADPLVDSKKAMAYIEKGEAMAEKIAEQKMKVYQPMLNKMYERNDQEGINSLLKGLKKDPYMKRLLGDVEIVTSGVGGDGHVTKTMTADEVWKLAQTLPEGMRGKPEDWPAGRYEYVHDKGKVTLKPLEEKNKTDYQVTFGALKDELGRNPTDREVKTAMQKDKLEQMRAGRTIIDNSKAKDIDIPSLAQSVIDGQDAPMSIKGSMGNPVSTKVKSEILKRYPKFNSMMADANYKWKQSTVNQRTINFAGGSLPRVAALDEQLSKLPNVNMNTINKIMAATSKEFGKPEYTNFESNRNAIVQEINTALSGSATGSDMRVKLELENLTSARSPAQIKGAISNLREALIARLDVDLSPIYPQEVVKGEKTMEEYKKELFATYRGQYNKKTTNPLENNQQNKLSTGNISLNDIRTLNENQLSQRLQGMGGMDKNAAKTQAKWLKQAESELIKRGKAVTEESIAKTAEYLSSGGK